MLCITLEGVMYSDKCTVKKIDHMQCHTLFSKKTTILNKLEIGK